jgi:hypothetical protein
MSFLVLIRYFSPKVILQRCAKLEQRVQDEREREMAI